MRRARRKKPVRSRLWRLTATGAHSLFLFARVVVLFGVGVAEGVFLGVRDELREHQRKKLRKERNSAHR